MNTAVCQNQLQILEQQLRQAFVRHLPQPLTVSIRCAVKQGILLILIQHSADVTPDPDSTFAAMKQAVRSLSPQVRTNVGAVDALAVRLYLRQMGQPQSYAVDTLELSDPAQDEGMPEVNEADPETSAEVVTFEQVEEVPDGLDAEDDAADDLEDQPGELVWVGHESATLLRLMPEPETALAEIDSSVPPPHTHLSLFSRLQWGILTGTVVILSALSGGMYAVTRPCIVGACLPLQQAQHLGETAVQSWQANPSAQEVVKTYEQLVEANYLLGTIPRWSKHYPAAQAMLANYETETEELGWVVKAQQQAMQAAIASQNPPHPMETWKQVQALWREAIAHLEQVPEASVVYTLAQRKLDEYGVNLAAINQRIKVEQDAQNTVNAARSAAQIAEARVGIANSMESWQLAHATWQTAINRLAEVPRGTMVHAEAQQLLAIYQPKLAVARDRRTQEEISANAYNQALRLAEQARQQEQQNQWSPAVDLWQRALTYAQQVPTGTSYYSQAQPLVQAYGTSLSEARDNLRLAVAMQSARSSLDRLCRGTPRVCTYTLVGENIRVRVTSDYDRAVEQAIASTELTGDYVMRAEVTSHVHTLLRALAAISENADIPIELYNSDGSLFGTYVPSLSGYVSR